MSTTLKATSTWDTDTVPDTKTKTRRFKEESRSDGQHSPSTSNSTRHGNMDTDSPSKVQASKRTNNDGKGYVKHHTPGQNNTHLCKRKDKGYRRD